jgi:hypothetical protein
LAIARRASTARPEARAARHFDAATAGGRVRARSGRLARDRAVIVASERLDEDPGWFAEYHDLQ